MDRHSNEKLQGMVTHCLYTTNFTNVIFNLMVLGTFNLVKLLNKQKVKKKIQSFFSQTPRFLFYIDNYYVSIQYLCFQVQDFFKIIESFSPQLTCEY